MQKLLTSFGGLVVIARQIALVSGGNVARAMRMANSLQRGIAARSAVEMLILIFIAIVVIYQLIPQISGSNVTVQSSANVSTMGKFAAGLGEWMFPLLGVVAVVFLLFQRGRSKGI